MNADDDTDDEDPVEDAAVVFVVVDGDAGPVVPVVVEAESCDGTVAADNAAAAADFSISSNSRLKIDRRQPIR